MDVCVHPFARGSFFFLPNDHKSLEFPDLRNEQQKYGENIMCFNGSVVVVVHSLFSIQTRRNFNNTINNVGSTPAILPYAFRVCTAFQQQQHSHSTNVGQTIFYRIIMQKRARGKRWIIEIYVDELGHMDAWTLAKPNEQQEQKKNGK